MQDSTSRDVSWKQEEAREARTPVHRPAGPAKGILVALGLSIPLWAVILWMIL